MDVGVDPDRHATPSYRWTLQQCTICRVPPTVFVGRRGGPAHRDGLGIESSIWRCAECDLLFPNPMPIPVQGFQQHYAPVTRKRKVRVSDGSPPNGGGHRDGQRTAAAPTGKGPRAAPSLQGLAGEDRAAAQARPDAIAVASAGGRREDAEAGAGADRRLGYDSRDLKRRLLELQAVLRELLEQRAGFAPRPRAVKATSRDMS